MYPHKNERKMRRVKKSSIFMNASEENPGYAVLLRQHKEKNSRLDSELCATFAHTPLNDVLAGFCFCPSEESVGFLPFSCFWLICM